MIEFPPILSTLKPCAANGGWRGVRTYLTVAQSAGYELSSSITRPPYRVRERLPFGRRRLVRDRSAPEVVRELHGACAVPHCSLRQAERALQRREVVWHALCMHLSYFSMHRTLAHKAYLVMLHYNGDAYDGRATPVVVACGETS